MRQLFFCIAGLILQLAPAVFSHANPVQKEPALNDNFYGVTILADRAWIVGYYGTILHSQDRGVTWEIQRSPSRSALYSVRFVTPDRGWISGSYGALLRTQDRGKNWTAIPSGTTEHLFNLSWPDSRNGWAAGSRGVILRTADGGGSWTNSSVKEDLTFSSVSFVNPRRGWIAGEFGVIFQTQDAGKSWVKQKSPVEVTFSSGESRILFALLFPDVTTGFAFGIDGLILRTQGGKSWQIMRQKSMGEKSISTNHLFAAAASDSRLWTVGERGTILRADPAGENWQAVKAAIPPVSLNSIAFGKKGFGLIVGNQGLVLRTEDGGTVWKPLTNLSLAARKDAHRLP
jgi:photosystem II stability/assembly factor-like uncharacterized protein